MKTLLIATGLLLFFSWGCESSGKKSQSVDNQAGNANESALRDTNYPEMQVNYENLGMDIVNNAQATLSQNLIRAVQQKGAAGAVEFCNERAYPLSDSVAKIHNAKIKRVSDKERNPNNKANEEEISIIYKMKEMLAQDAKAQPVIKEKNGKIQAYYPIITNSLCLKCHGKVQENILSETYATIQSLYPQDKAR